MNENQIQNFLWRIKKAKTLAEIEAIALQLSNVLHEPTWVRLEKQLVRKRNELYNAGVVA